VAIQYLSSGPKQPEPHLKLALHPADASFPDVELTNAVFTFKNIKYKAVDIRGNVIIPIAITNADFVLDFVLVNDSKNESVSGTHIWMFVAKKFRYAVSDLWVKVPSGDPELDCWSFGTKEQIFPDEHVTIEGLKCKPTEVLNTSVPLNFTISVSGSPNMLMGFWLSFENAATVTKPHILTDTKWSGSNGLKFTIPLER
jgi:hypothetical protein